MVTLRPSSSYMTGLILAILAATGFASKAIFVKLAYRYGVDGTTMVTIRLILVLPIVLCMRLLRPGHGAPLNWKDRGMILFLGLIGYYLSSLFDFLGLQTVDASIERLVLCLYPTLTMMMSAWLTKSQISRRMWTAMGITYIGLVFVLVPGFFSAHIDPLGMFFVVASTLCYAVYLTLSPSLIRRIGSMRFAELALSISALAMLLHYVITRPVSILVHQPAPVWIYGIVMAIIATVLPLYALAAAMDRIGAGKAALIGSIGPILTIFMSIGILDEHLNPIQWCGVCIVLGGIWLVGQRRT